MSKACKIMNVSRNAFYCYRKLVDEDGVDLLISRSCQDLNVKKRTDDSTVRAVVNYAINF